MQVELIGWTENADEIAEQAAAICWQSSNPQKSLQMAISYGHTSVLEHNCFTWRITGISSAALAQMTRHRIGCSYSVQSFRHTAPGQEHQDTLPVVNVPDTIANDPEAKRQYEAAIGQATITYQNMIHAGISKQDARYVLPMAFTRSMIVSMNARALLHFAELRITPQAEKEIFGIAVLMYNLAREKAPRILQPLSSQE